MIPRAAEWVLTHLVRPEAAEVIAGDLREEYRAIVESRGAAGARLWYWRQVCAAIVLCRLRLPRRVHARRGGERLMARLIQDLRFAVRTLGKRPAFTLGAVGALGIGIGLTTAVFSVVDAVLLRPLPYPDASRVVVLQQTNVDDPDDLRISPATYMDWRDGSRAFRSTAAVRPWSYTFSTTSDPQVLPAGLVSEGFFDVLGVRPMLGRTFVREDYLPGAARVVIICHDLWMRQFGGDPAIVGRPLRFDASGTLTIVGVMGPDFKWLDQTQAVWGPYPMPENLRQQRAAAFLRVVARLADDAPVESARAEAAVVRRRLVEAPPRVYGNVDLVVTPVDDAMFGRVRTPILILLAAVSLVALIACANVGSLLIARAAERRLEFGIRTAIGARPRHLATQLLAEGFVLAAAGTVLGLLIAAAILPWAVAATPGSVPRLEDASLSWRVFLFAAAAGACVTGLVSLVPMVHVRRADSSGALRSQTASRAGGRRVRETLLAAEVALTVLLLTGAGLLAHSFLEVTRVDPGFSAANVAVLETHVWDALPKAEQQAQFVDDALARFRQIPGVSAAGAVTAMPFLGSGSIEMEGTVSGASVRDIGAGERRSAWLTIASEGYFEVLQMQSRAGRTFTARDRAGSLPVAVVTESFARHFLTGDPIGATVSIANRRTPVPLTIVGVVNDLRHTALENPGREEIFIPMAQSPFGSVTFVVRATNGASSILPQLKETIRGMNAAQTFPTAAALDRLVDVTVVPRRFYLALAGTLATFAFLLAALGIYSLTAFVTIQRTKEFGVRMALGGSRRDILRLVVGGGMAAPIAGLLLGGTAAAAMSRLLESYLFGIGPADPATFGAVGALVIVVTLGAACIPALRAVRIDPTVALRHE